MSLTDIYKLKYLEYLRDLRTIIMDSIEWSTSEKNNRINIADLNMKQLADQVKELYHPEHLQAYFTKLFEGTYGLRHNYKVTFYGFNVLDSTGKVMVGQIYDLEKEVLRTEIHNVHLDEAVRLNRFTLNLDKEVCETSWLEGEHGNFAELSETALDFMCSDDLGNKADRVEGVLYVRVEDAMYQDVLRVRFPEGRIFAALESIPGDLLEDY